MDYKLIQPRFQSLGSYETYLRLTELTLEEFRKVNKRLDETNRNLQNRLRAIEREDFYFPIYETSIEVNTLRKQLRRVEKRHNALYKFVASKGLANEFIERMVPTPRRAP